MCSLEAGTKLQDFGICKGAIEFLQNLLVTEIICIDWASVSPRWFGPSVIIIRPLNIRLGSRCAVCTARCARTVCPQHRKVCLNSPRFQLRPQVRPVGCTAAKRRSGHTVVVGKPNSFLDGVAYCDIGDRHAVVIEEQNAFFIGVVYADIGNRYDVAVEENNAFGGDIVQADIGNRHAVVVEEQNAIFVDVV